MKTRGPVTGTSRAVQKLGYPAAFLVLGSFAVGSIVIWLWFSSVLKPACATKPDEGGALTVPALAS
jgi:hypothetical protein